MAKPKVDISAAFELLRRAENSCMSEADIGKMLAFGDGIAHMNAVMGKPGTVFSALTPTHRKEDDWPKLSSKVKGLKDLTPAFSLVYVGAVYMLANINTDLFQAFKDTTLKTKDEALTNRVFDPAIIAINTQSTVMTLLANMSMRFSPVIHAVESSFMPLFKDLIESQTIIVSDKEVVDLELVNVATTDPISTDQRIVLTVVIPSSNLRRYTVSPVTPPIRLVNCTPLADKRITAEAILGARNAR
jgi:hypothetical protein